MEQQDLETGVESEVSEDSFETDPVLTKYQTEAEQKRWSDELSAARKERKQFDTRAVKTIERYGDIRDDQNQNASRYNLLFANIDTKAAALYARIPAPDIRRRYSDADDQVGRVAANLLQRNLSYELETGDFDSKFKNMVWDRLVPGIGIGWVRLEQEEGEPEQTLTYDIYGNPIVTDVPGSEIKDQNAEIDYVSWEDFLSAPCQVWTDCRWVSRRIPMSKEAIETRFSDTVDKKVLSDLSYEKEDSTKGGPSATSRLKPKNTVKETVDIFEIWDKETRLIYWIAEGSSIPLDVKADTNEFDNFFPTPLPPLGRFTTSSTIAISDYSLVQDLYRDLDNLQNRIAMLIQALQLKWVYDSGNPALKELYTTTPELQGIGVKDWAIQMGEKGGLKAAIEFAPLEEIADTYQKCLAAQEKLKQQIWEIEAIPDFIRGETQAYDSAAATQQKGAFGTSRLSTYQREVAKYAEALIRLKAHLICKFYKPEIIAQRAGMMPQADQQYVQSAIQLLGQELLSSFRLEVSVDSIQLANWNLERGDRTQLVQAVGQMLGQLMQATQQNPAIAPLGMHLLKFAVSGYKGSSEIEGYIDAGLDQLAQMAAQTQGQPKPPTPAETQAQAQKAQINGQMQIAQIQEQGKQNVAQLNAQVEAQKLQWKQREAEMQAQLDQANLALKAFQIHTTANHQAHDNAHTQAMDLVGLTEPRNSGMGM
jgi:hypothetical protein